MKRVLILGAPLYQIPVVVKAKEMGLYVGIVDIKSSAPAFPYADISFCSSITDVDSVLEIAKNFRPDGIIIGACDTSVVTCAKVCNFLKLPCYPVEVAIKATNKYRMLEAFKEHNVSHPKYQLVKKREIFSFILGLSYPIISKPVDSSGGRGIMIIHNADDLYRSVKYSSECGVSGDVLLEEYMRGTEVSVEVLVVEGVPYILQITDKITSGEPHFFEVGHSQPSVLPRDIKSEIKTLASSAVLSVGLYNSVAHVEIMVTDDGPKIVELGARLGGDCITSYLIDNSIVGINMTQCAIELALNIRPNISSISDSGLYSAVLFFPSKQGYLCSIEGLDSIPMNNVIDLKITARIGESYSDPVNNSGRFGYVVCIGSTKHEALDNCKRIIDNVSFVMKTEN